MSAEENKPEENDNETEAPATVQEAGVSDADKFKQEMLYMRAEFENTKRRLLRDQETSIRFANEKLIGELLTVLDLFERALQAGETLKTKGTDEAKSFYTGIEMTHRELTHLLSRFGVELTGAIGEKFDPNKHEALSQAPADEDKVDTVLAVIQRGCLLQGRMIKPARVVVGIAKS